MIEIFFVYFQFEIFNNNKNNVKKNKTLSVIMQFMFWCVIVRRPYTYMLHMFDKTKSVDDDAWLLKARKKDVTSVLDNLLETQTCLVLWKKLYLGNLNWSKTISLCVTCIKHDKSEEISQHFATGSTHFCFLFCLF